MRVLAVCLPSPGHVNPLLPLLRAFVEQGDEVLVACGEEARERVEGTGARHHRAGTGYPDWFARLAARTRGQPGDGLPPGRIGHYFVPRLFAEIAADDMADEVVAAARELRPDLVVYETQSLSGPLAATVVGAPAVQLQVGPTQAGDVVDLVVDALSPLWRSFGLPIERDRMASGDLIVRTMPSILDPPSSLEADQLSMRPVPLPRHTQPPRGRPLVHVTFGTVLNTDLDSLRLIVETVAARDVDVIATVGSNNDPAALGPVPDNVLLERYVDHADLLPRCSAVVHHGGAGTMLSSLAHGLPQVVVPQGADQFDNAAALEQAGIAVALLPGHVTRGEVETAVTAVLGNPAYRERAQGAAAEIAAMPDVTTVAEQLRRRYGR